MRYIYEHLKDIPVEIEYPEDFEKTVNESLYKSITYNRYKKIAHCSYCGKTFDYIDKLRKGDATYCPYCYAKVVAMPHTCYPTGSYESYVWMFYRNNIIYFVEAEASWMYAGQPIDGIEDVTRIKLRRIICISHQSQYMYVYRYHHQDWYQCKGGKVYLDTGYYKNLVKKEQLDNTFLRYMDIYPWDADYMVKEAALCAKYPQVEFVKKAGLGDIVRGKITNNPTYVYPNWKGRTIPEFLRLSPQDVDKLKSWDMFDLENIAVYKKLSKTRKVKKNHIKTVRRIFDTAEINSADKDKDLVKLATYLAKQTEMNIHESIRGFAWAVKNEYADYIRQLVKLGYPINDYYRYPKSLKVAHDRVSEEYREKLAEERRVKAAERQKQYEKKYLPKLEKLIYSDDQYLIRPLRDMKDFDNEGRSNKNCVASYYDRATEGITSVFVLRKIGAEEESFVTIELDFGSKKIKQCYAGGNRIPDSEVTAWADRWLEQVVKKKKGRAA